MKKEDFTSHGIVFQYIAEPFVYTFFLDMKKGRREPIQSGFLIGLARENL